MANSRFHNYLLVLWASLLLHPSSQSQPNLHSHRNHVALFIFGDSLFDVGNNNYLKSPIGSANFWPYGETFFKHPTGRVSDGRLIIDFIAEYLKLPLIFPYLQPGNHQFTDGVNFASGGAGALVETHQGDEGRIKKQIGGEETKTLLSKAIYIISIGGNDYAAPSIEFESFPKEDYVEMVIGNLTSVIKDIYKIGGRKFVFVGVGSFDCAPIMRSLEEHRGSCNKEIKAMIELHNLKLSNTLKEIQGRLKEFHYVFFDFYTTLSERISNPSKFGFKEAKVACCGAGPYRGDSNCGLAKGFEVCHDVSEYIFFDSIHPTEKVYKQLANLIWNGSHNVSRLCNLKEMLEA
ncbi:zinc finger protein, putative [Ricinus communis]|uniref:Zinc finger protein, putative n=1 Tax=Ricinus communis TaxID=3988 RepID=B9T4S4_RICCO|nr:zinc finger protein, putative [Ricinus communis]